MPRNSPALRHRLLAIALGLLVTLAVGEVAARLLGAPEVAVVRRGRFQLSANPRLLFEPVPGLSFEGDPRYFHEYEGTGNRLGYRDRDHPQAKPPGTVRIAVLGDSIAAGHRIPRTEEAFPALLETLLRQAGQPVEVLNFGVTGYNTAQEVETLRSRALAFAPDLVLLAYCHNDRRPPDPRILAALRESQGDRPVVPLAEAGRLLVASALYRSLRYGLFDRPEPAAHPPAADEVAIGPQPGDTVEPSLAELAEISRRHGFPVLVAVFPFLPKLYDRGHAREHAWLAETTRKHGFHHLDLRPAFRDCRGGAGRGGKTLGFDRYHPTPAGHRCAAEAMAAAVLPLLKDMHGNR
jgi:lysophospholipase L1-like esterase